MSIPFSFADADSGYDTLQRCRSVECVTNECVQVKCYETALDTPTTLERIIAAISVGERKRY